MTVWHYFSCLRTHIGSTTPLKAKNYFERKQSDVIIHMNTHTNGYLRITEFVTWTQSKLTKHILVTHTLLMEAKTCYVPDVFIPICARVPKQ